MDRRKKNADWLLNLNSNGNVSTGDAQLAVLMDIRDELQTLNRVLKCPNFQAIPRKLDAIRKNTVKPRKKKNL